MTIFDDILKPFKSIGHDIDKTTKNIGKVLHVAGDKFGHSIDKIGKGIGKGIKDTGKWFKQAGDDIGHTVGSVGNRLLTDVDNISSGLSSALKNPIIWVAVGGGVILVLILVMKK